MVTLASYGDGYYRDCDRWVVGVNTIKQILSMKLVWDGVLIC